jgi:hypothetical protein
MPPNVPANLLEFFFPTDSEGVAVAPCGDTLDSMSRPLSKAELHEAAEIAIADRFALTREQRHIAKMLYAQLDSPELDEIAERHSREFHERRKGAKPSQERLGEQPQGELAPQLPSSNPGGESGAARSLHAAAVDGLAADIASLAEAGCDLDSIDASGWTPAHSAAAANNFATLGELLLRGANPDARTPEGSTPLMLAVGAMAIRCVEILMPVSDRQARDHEGCSARHYAPNFHTDEDDPHYKDILRFVALMQSLSEDFLLAEEVSGSASRSPSRSL